MRSKEVTIGLASGLEARPAALDPPVGKSGVNHRLRKLCDIAEQLRDRSERSRME